MDIESRALLHFAAIVPIWVLRPRETSWQCHVGMQAGKPPQRMRLLGTLLLGLAASTAHAQSQPLSLDDQLRDQLALGDADGCVDLLHITDDDIAAVGAQQAVVNELADLGPEIGNELRAICGPSAVGSASSLGGALDSVQATKTVSQFKLARRRIDQRLPRRGQRPKSASLMLMLQGEPQREISRYASEGYGVFGQIDYEWRERDATRFEDGYKGHVQGGSLGFDFAWDRGVAGVWGGYAKTDADFRGGSVQAFTPDDDPDPALDSVLSDPTVLSSVCGGVLPGGEFDLEGSRFGLFVSWKFGESAFLDFAASRSHLDYNYARDTCVIEAQGDETLVFEDGVLFNDGNENGLDAGDQVVDDIYAGTVSGDTTLTEDGLSIRAGFDKDAGAWSFGPRATLYYLRSQVDGYAETGSSTVDNTVTPVADENVVPVQRTLGGPLGLELAYEDRDEDATLLEVGGVVERHFETDIGMLIAHASGYWRHQFDDSRRFTTAQFVQDFRSTPTQFTFASDEIDPDNALFSLGVTALFAQRAAVRLEVTHLAFDMLVDSTAVSLQFRVAL